MFICLTLQRYEEYLYLANFEQYLGNFKKKKATLEQPSSKNQNQIYKL